MTLATVGVRQWAQGLWQRTRETVGLGLATRWPGRLAIAAPSLDRGPTWGDALAVTLAVEREPDADADAAARATRRRAASSLLTYPRRGAGSAPAPAPAHRARLDESRRAQHTHIESTAGASLRAASTHAAVSPDVLARVLHRYAGGFAAPPPTSAAARHLAPAGPTRGRSAQHVADVVADAAAAPARTAWVRLLATRAAHRFVAAQSSVSVAGSNGAGHRGDAGARDVSARIADVLVQTLDTSLAGDRADAGLLLGAARPAAGAAASAPASGAPSPAAASRASTHPSVGRARRGWDDEHAAAGTDTALRGDRPDADPLRPVGLATPDSAPAPDGPVSAMPSIAGSVSRIAPPSGTPSLPPLVPRAISQPPALGLTGPALRHATRAEDPDVDLEETARLADRLRRLLRDEARRQGIALQ